MDENNKIKYSNTFSHLAEDLIRSQKIFKTSVEPYLSTIQNMSNSVVTIGQKIEPLLKIQQQLTDSTYSINSIIQKTPTIDFNQFSYISEKTIQTKTSLEMIQDFALKSNSLFNATNYDFLINPISSTLNIAVDNVALQQKNILKDLDSIVKIGTIVSPKFNEWDSTSLKINNIALNALRESPYLFPSPRITTIPFSRDPTTERIEKLENEVKYLKNKKEKNIIIEINYEVEKLLLEIHGPLSKMFKGAYEVIDQNDDSLAQSAESMTRLLENLPFHLVKEFKPKEKIKEKIIKEILAKHLSLESNSLDEINHPLITQQHQFYETFSQIRHRNNKIYSEFEKDPARYKALLIQVEGFLYQLIKG